MKRAYLFLALLYPVSAYSAGVDAIFYIGFGVVIVLIITIITPISMLKAINPRVSNNVKATSLSLIIFNYFASIYYYRYFPTDGPNYLYLIPFTPFVIALSVYFVFYLFNKHEQSIPDKIEYKQPPCTVETEILIDRVINNDIKGVKASLYSGGNPLEQDSSGYTAIDYARGHSHNKILEILTKHNNSFNPDGAHNAPPG